MVDDVACTATLEEVQMLDHGCIPDMYELYCIISSTCAMVRCILQLTFTLQYTLFCEEYKVCIILWQPHTLITKNYWM